MRRSLTQRRRGGKDARIEVYVDWVLCGLATWRLGVEMVGKETRNLTQRREDGKDARIEVYVDWMLSGSAALR